MKLRNERAVVNAMYRHSFAAFCYGAFPVVHSGQQLEPNWHIEATCHELQSMLEGRSPNRLVLNVPPRSLKSYIVSICWPAWLLGHNPSLAVVVASYSEDLGFKFSRECRKLMGSAFYKRLFPGTRLTKSSEGEFETTQGGLRLTTSVGGTLTGRGADVLIIDDPMKADDADSEVRREGANEWFRNTALSRLNQPANSLVIVVMQRLHQDDLSGVLIEAGWRSLVIPAIAEATSEYRTGYDTVYRREVGENLQKTGPYSTNYESQRRDLGGRLFSAQYQQDPIPADGNMVRRDWLKRYDDIPQRFDRILVSVDTAAATNSHTDYTAIVVVGVKDRHLYVISVRRGRWGIRDQEREILESVRQFRAALVLIENESSGCSLISMVKEHGVDVVGVNPRGSKLQRMSNNQGRIEAGRLFLPQEAPWLADFEKELLSFPSARHDDQVDALIQFMEWYRENESYLEPIAAVGGFVVVSGEPWPHHMAVARGPVFSFTIGSDYA